MKKKQLKREIDEIVSQIEALAVAFDALVDRVNYLLVDLEYTHTSKKERVH